MIINPKRLAILRVLHAVTEAPTAINGSPRAISNACGKPDDWAWRELGAMRRDGLAEPRPEPLCSWRITDAGRDALAALERRIAA